MDLSKGCTSLIIAECKKHGLLRNQCAYALATAWHETAHTMKPVREYGGETYLRSKKYYPYVGMGFVQLTWLTNYKRATNELGVDFVANPKLLLKPEYSATILVVGMKEGWFSGDKKGRHKLDRYITLSASDFKGARRIINGTDKAVLVATHAAEYDRDLKAIGYGEEGTTQPVPAPSAPQQPPRTQAPPVGRVVAKHTIEAAQKRLADLGYNPGGIDGKTGPLTSAAVMAFKNDNGLQPNDAIDDAFLAALATASPRKLDPARENATGGEVAAKVPEANVHWWTRLGAWIVGGGTTAAGAADYIAPATSYLTPVKTFVGDLPGYVWIIGIVVLCIVLYLGAQYGVTKSKEAFNTGKRL